MHIKIVYYICTNLLGPSHLKKGIIHCVKSPKKEKVNGPFIRFTMLFQLDKLKALFIRESSQKRVAFSSVHPTFKKIKERKGLAILILG